MLTCNIILCLTRCDPMHCRTISFKALLLLLRCPPQSVTNTGPEMAAKFADLVVKCLIKLTKSLQSTIQVRMTP